MKNISDIDCSIIIPHYNQAYFLQKCLKALPQQDFQGNTEVIVIDNGSADFNIQKWQKDHPKVLWLRNNEKKNPYTSRNLGAKHAKGKYLAFIDAKCYPTSSWLRNMITMRNEEHPIIAGRYKLYYNSDALKDKVYGMLYLNNEKNVRKGYGITTGNLLVDRKYFQNVGPFNDELNSGNDIEWSLRALKFGHKIEYAQEAIISYPAQSWEELTKSVNKYAHGVARIDRKGKWAIGSFLPLRRSTFNDHLTHRSLNHLSACDRAMLFILIWLMKVKFAVALSKSRKKLEPLSLNSSK